MKRSVLLTGAAAAVLALAACNGDATSAAANSSLSNDEAQALASSMAASTGDALAESFGGWGTFDRLPAAGSVEVAAATVTRTETFSRTRSCPAGGTVTVAGTRSGTADAATKTGSWTETATRTDAACAHTVRTGVTVTVNGAPNVAITSSHSRTNGTPGTWTHTEKGAFDWSRSNGKSGHCTVDVTSTYDPAAKTYHTKGTICNVTFDKTITHDTP
ncbi:MAG TPA: hypothetical protein VFE05_02320 [Longimicrobiaceae bacterium]|jgi:hypothetical protein|nr:hypothetical protein [Longimicrobiaceae bacterium]